MKFPIIKTFRYNAKKKKKVNVPKNVFASIKNVFIDPTATCTIS